MAKRKPMKLNLKKGAYHEHTGVPKGKKIPLSQIKKDEHSKDKHVRKMAQFADNARKFKHSRKKK